MRLRTLSLITVFTSLTIFVSCSGDYRELADGNTREIVVVMDSTKWDSEVADAIRETFGKYIFTLPNAEPSYNLHFRDFFTQDQLERVQKQKNIIFAAPINEESNVGNQIRGFLDNEVEERVKSGESFAFPINNLWYRDQLVMILTSTSDSALAQKIRNTDEALTESFLEKELERWRYFVYEKKEQVQYSDSMWKNHGFKVRIQHDYIKNIDTLNFMSFRRFLPQND